jgi:hypothetical protein
MQAHAAASMKKHLTKELAIVWALYAAAYTTWRHLGVTFEIAATYHMHFLDFEQLRADAMRSLFYMHSQPPIFMLLLSLGIKLAGRHVSIFMEAITFISGLATLFGLRMLLEMLGVRRWLRMAMFIWLVLPPTFTIYHAWAYSTPLEIAVTSFLCVALLAHFQTPARRYLHGLGACLCTLALLHSRWHFIVIISFVALLVKLTPAPQRRALLIVVLLWLTPLAAWITKNQILFGVPGVSSWLGANIVQIVSAIPSPPEMEALKAEGLISAHYPIGFNAALIEKVMPEALMPPPAHPVLALKKHQQKDVINFNYAGMVLTSAQDAHDSWVIIKTYPWRYVERCWGRFLWLTATPAMSYPFLGGYSRLYRAAGMQNVHFSSFDALPVGLQQWLRQGAFMLYTAIPLACLAWALLRRNPPQSRFILCTSWLIWLLLAISCLTCGWEQERMRFGSIAIYLAYLGLTLQAALTFLEKTRKHVALLRFR